MLSYSKVRALFTIATAGNETELLDIALDTPCGELRMELARWHSNLGNGCRRVGPGSVYSGSGS